MMTQAYSRASISPPDPSPSGGDQSSSNPEYQSERCASFDESPSKPSLVAYSQSPSRASARDDEPRPAQRALLSGTTLEQWVTAAAKGRHPLVVFLIAIASNFVGMMPELLLRYAYVFLILAFSGSIFLLVKLASGSSALASMSALAAALSPSTTVGMYTGIIGNWLALVVWALALTPLVIENVHGFRWRAMLSIGLASGSVAVLLLHPYSWIVFVVGLAAYSVILLFHRRKLELRDLVILAIVILINGIAVGMSLLYLSNVQHWGLADVFLRIQRSNESRYLGLGTWEILVYFSQIWSQFLHPLFLSLSVLGVFVLVRDSRRAGPLVLAWIVAASLTTLAAAPMGYSPLLPGRGQTQLFRALFLTPFQIPVAVGILSVRYALNERLGQSRGAKAVAAILLLVLFLAILNGALRALFPLLSDPHSLSTTQP